MPGADGSIVIDTKIDDSGFKNGIRSLCSGAAKAGKFIAGAFAVTAAAAAGLGALVMHLLKVGEESQVGSQRLTQIAKSMGLFGKQTDEVVARLEEYANITAAATGIDDDIIKSTQAKLLTFRELAKTADEVGGAFDRATRAAIDMQAAGFGQAEQNAVQLGKALQDPIKGVTALARSGITFTASEKKKLKALTESGQILRAQDMMLKAIEKQVGGTAAATAKATDRIAWKWGELQEAAGSALVPAFESAADGIMEFMDTLQGPIEEAFGGLADVLSGKKGGAERITSGFSNLAQQVAGGLGSVLPPLINAFSGIIVGLAQALPGLLPPVVDAFLAAWSSIAASLPDIIPPLIAALSTVLVSMSQAVPGFVTQFAQGFTALITALAPQLPAIFAALATSTVQEFSAIAEQLPIILPALIDAFTTVIEGVAEILPTLMPVINQAVVDASPALTAAFIKLLPALVVAFARITSALVIAAPKLITAFLTSFQAQSPRMGKAMSSAMGEAWKSAQRKWESAKATFIARMKSLPGLIGKALGKMKDVGVNLVRGIWNGIVDKFNWLVTMIKIFARNVKNQLKAFFGIKSPSVWAEREIGVNLALGIGRGFTRTAPSIAADMARSVSGEMGRFAASVGGLQSNSTTYDNSRGDTHVHFAGPVRTYSEVVRAMSDIERGLVT